VATVNVTKELSSFHRVNSCFGPSSSTWAFFHADLLDWRLASAKLFALEGHARDLLFVHNTFGVSMFFFVPKIVPCVK
jgi:hypothetical protein